MKSQDLTTLAALSALDALDPEEQAWVNQALSHSPEGLSELEDMQFLVSSLAYGAPLVEMAPSLKARLFDRIQSEEVSTTVNPCADRAFLAELQAQVRTVKWEDYVPTPGTELGILRVDPENREVYCFVRSQGAVNFPLHRHAGEEEIVVLEGDLRIGNQSYYPGDRICSTVGTAHQPITDGGCLIYLRTSLDDELLSE